MLDGGYHHSLSLYHCTCVGYFPYNFDRHFPFVLHLVFSFRSVPCMSLSLYTWYFPFVLHLVFSIRVFSLSMDIPTPCWLFIDVYIVEAFYK
jgi:hypothetical protein